MNLIGELKRMWHLSEILRKDMPQVKSKELDGAMSNLVKTGVRVRGDRLSVSDVKFTQEDYIPEKVAAIVSSIRSGKPMPPIVVSSDHYIVDGHHRWLAAKEAFDSSKKINVVVIDLPISSALVAYEKVSKE